MTDVSLQPHWASEGRPSRDSQPRCAYRVITNFPRRLPAPTTRKHEENRQKRQMHLFSASETRGESHSPHLTPERSKGRGWSHSKAAVLRVRGPRGQSCFSSVTETPVTPHTVTTHTPKRAMTYPRGYLTRVLGSRPSSKSSPKALPNTAFGQSRV